MAENPNGQYQARSAKVLTPAGSIVNPVEEVTGGYKSITTDHAAIHGGIAFTVAHKFTIAAAGSAYLEFIVPAGAYVHFKPVAMQTDAPKVLVQVIEAPTVTPGTTGKTPMNRRRIGTPTVSVVTVHTDPTGVSGGTVIDQDYIGGGTGAGGSSVSGGMGINENEWVLNPATTYLVKVTNGGSGSADVNIKLFWYEELAG